jgi:hypothetical protein
MVVAAIMLLPLPPRQVCSGIGGLKRSLQSHNPLATGKLADCTHSHESLQSNQNSLLLSVWL